MIIAGGGLAGCLAALALAERRPDVPFILLEQGERFGGAHVWSFFDSDVDVGDKWLVEDIVARRWPEHEVHFPKRSRRLHFGYNSITSDKLDSKVRQRLRPHQYRLRASIAHVAADHVVLESGERIEGEGVIDARGPVPTPGLRLGWQKFVGRRFRFSQPHGFEQPVIMDGRVDQEDGYRFVYTLPFSETELLVEDTYYSDASELDRSLLRERIDHYIRWQGWGEAELVSEEEGVLPVLIAGKIQSLWPSGEVEVARLGLRGGFFHPTTGYSLPDAVRNAALLAEQTDFRSPALHRLYRDRAAQLWRDRRFYQLLNRMLFRGAAPDQRYRVLEHFYRLPEQVIARFYAAKLTRLDKLRILSGRPPVPIGRALLAMREAG